MGIGSRTNKTFSQQIINDPLNVLAVRAHVARQPCDGLGTFRRYDCPEHLPSRTCQSQWSYQTVARCHQT